MTLFCCAAMEQYGIKAGGLDIPENIELFHIPPYTPEMNPIERFGKRSENAGFATKCLQHFAKSWIVFPTPSVHSQTRLSQASQAEPGFLNI